MALKIMQEVTKWKITFRQPNHVYLMSGDRVIAVSKWGESLPEYLKSQNRMDRRGRKFVEVEKNLWHFDLSTKLDSEEQPGRVKGETWEVLGAKGNRYTVSWDSGRWSCTCPGHGFRNRCRHVDELRASVQQPA